MGRKRTKNRGADVLVTLPAQPVASQPSWLVPAICLGLVLAVFAVFGQTVFYEFITFDDGDYVYNNRHVIDGITLRGISWALRSGHATNWHPLTWLSHMLDCQLYGLSPGGHHLTNILIHAANAVVLFLLLRRMTGEVWPSAFVATIFAVHPLRVESVAWVAERKDVLSSLLFFLTLHAYVSYVRNSRSWRSYFVVIGVFVVALMAKPMVVTLPFVLLLLDFWPLGRIVDNTTSTSRSNRHSSGFPSFSVIKPLIIEKLPLFAFALASCGITLIVQKRVVEAALYVPMSARISNALVAYVAYLGQLIWPTDLAILYPHPISSLPAWEVVAAGFVVFAITAIAVRYRDRFPYWPVGWFWYMGMLVPVIGIIQVGSQAMADRYTYLPQIGIVMAITWTAANLVTTEKSIRWSKRIGAGVIVAFGIAAFVQTQYWQSSETIWFRTLHCTSDNLFAEVNCGLIRLKQNRVDDARAHYARAVELGPGYPLPHMRLGEALLKQGQYDEAIVHLQHSLEIEPKFPEALSILGECYRRKGDLATAIDYFHKSLAMHSEGVDAETNLGAAIAETGDLPEAIKHFRRALEINPERPEAYNNLGAALAGQGKLPEAIEQYQKSLQLNPEYAEAHNNLGFALATQGKLAEATKHFRQALTTVPDYAKARYNLAEVLMRQQLFDDATAEWNRLVAGHQGDPVLLNKLAVAYAANNDATNATATAKQALEIARRQGNSALVQTIEAELKAWSTRK